MNRSTTLDTGGDKKRNDEGRLDQGSATASEGWSKKRSWKGLKRVVEFSTTGHCDPKEIERECPFCPGGMQKERFRGDVERAGGVPQPYH